MSRRTVLSLAIVAAGATIVVAIAILTSGSGDSGASGKPVSGRLSARIPGSPARFAYLAVRHSSQCGTPASYVLRLSSKKRLQGSCCFPMDASAYRGQVAGLRAYRGRAEIPRDPYDISVGLAKRLLAWEHKITLSRAQSATYRHAMKMTHEHGPCCCPCWRWHAFRGLSNELIARRRWSAQRLARVIDLVEGCGGGEHQHGRVSPHMAPA